MHNVQLMNVFNTSDNLVKKSACFSLFDSTVRHDVIKQFSSLCKLCNKIQLLWSFDNLRVILVYFLPFSSITS